MVDLERVKLGILSFANDQVIPNLPQTQQFIAGMGIGLIMSKADRLVDQLSSNSAVQMLGVIDGHQIDVDGLYHAAKEQIHRTPKIEVDVPLIGKLVFS